MLTIKVMKMVPGLPSVSGGPVPCLFSTKIVEVNEVEIHTHRPGKLYEVAGINYDGQSYAFYIANKDEPRPEGFADEIDFYYAAFIENSSGATTEVVKF